MTVFIRTKILSAEHLKVVFMNIGSFKEIHTKFIEAAKDIQQLKSDFCTLGYLLVRFCFLFIVREEKIHSFL